MRRVELDRRGADLEPATPYKSHLARAFTSKPSRSKGMAEQQQEQEQGGHGRKHRAMLGFSSLFGKGSKSSRTKAPPTPLALSNLVRPHPQAQVPARIRREAADSSASTNIIRISDLPQREQPTAPSASISALPQSQARRNEVVEEELWSHLPISAPPYRRWEGQRSEMKRSRSRGGATSPMWEVELHNEEDTEDVLDQGRPRSASGSSFPFELAPPAPGVLNLPRRAAAPLDSQSPRPQLASAFSTDTTLPSPAAPSIPPKSPTSLVSPSPFLHSPSASPSPSPSQESLDPITSAPTPVGFTNSESDTSLAHSSFQGFGATSEHSDVPRRSDSISFTQILECTTGSHDQGGKAGLQAAIGASSRESGILEQFEDKVEWPWSGSESINSAARSEESGRGRDEPLSAKDWQELEELVAERDGADEEKPTGGSGSNSTKSSKRHAIYLSTTSWLSELAVHAAAPGPSTAAQRMRRPHASSSNSSASCAPSSSTSSIDHRKASSDFQVVLGRGVRVDSASTTRSLHSPRSPDVRPFQSPRRSLQTPPSHVSGFSRSAEQTSSVGRGALPARLPRERARRHGLNRMATAETEKVGTNSRGSVSESVISKGEGEGSRGPLARMADWSAPEVPTRQEGGSARPNTTSRSTQTDRSPPSTHIGSSPSNGSWPSTTARSSGSHWSFRGSPSPRSIGHQHLQQPRPIPLAHRPSISRPSLHHGGTDSDSPLDTSTVQSAEMIDVRSPLGSPVAGRTGRRSMARASLVPLGGSGRFGVGGAGEKGSTKEVQTSTGGQEDELSMLRARNKELEEEVARLSKRWEERRE